MNIHGCSGSINSKRGEIMRFKQLFLMLGFFLTSTILQGCSEDAISTSTSLIEKETIVTPKEIPELQTNEELTYLAQFNRQPVEWGENVSGVKTRIDTDEKQISLTFDACGGDHGNSYDAELISFLKEEQIPTTLFVNERWIIANEDLFLELAAQPLFQIENHGTAHSPLSVNGGEAWGIPATKSLEEVHDEIMDNHETVQSLTGREMSLFRSGTAFYDEVAVEFANALGYEVVNFDILGDAGATYSSEQVKNALMGAKSGSIALLHMNQPGSGTAEGVKQAVPLLQEQGFEFVLLDHRTLQ